MPTPSPKQNRLLAALPAEVYRRLLPHLEGVSMPLGWVVHEAGVPEKHLYFMTSGIVSRLHIMKNGASGEIAVVGNEGVTGIALLMGGESTVDRAVVQSPGYAYRLNANVFKKEFADGPLRDLLLRYTHALITQMGHVAVCNRHHTVEQQLCRWLLLSIDRLDSRELYMTQDLIAGMLGVRRQTVTEMARKLQKAGLIDYVHGHITVLDRHGLESRACECYAAVKKEYARLFANKSRR